MTINSSDSGKIIRGLYCNNKTPRKDDYCRKECRQQKCLCMDSEQLAVLNLLASNPIYLATCTKKYIYQSKEDMMVDYCTMQAENVDRSLIHCDGKCTASVVNVISRYQYLDVYLTEVVKTLPLIQTINQTNVISDRYTLYYLIFFSKESPRFMKGFVISIISCLCDYQIEGDKEETVLEKARMALKDFEKTISELYAGTDMQLFLELLRDNTKQYLEKAYAAENSMYILKNIYEENLRTIDSWLEKLTGEEDDSKRKRNPLDHLVSEKFVNEKEEIIPLYRSMLELFGIVVPKAKFNSRDWISGITGISRSPMEDTIEAAKENKEFPISFWQEIKEKTEEISF